MAKIRCLGENHGDRFAAYHGDCVDVVRQMPDNSVGLSVYSPPFSGLYIYNDSTADMGNSASDEEFFDHYSFLAKELFRVTKPGRLVAIHCKDLVYYRTQRGTAGLRDFPGDLIRCHIDAGFDYDLALPGSRDDQDESARPALQAAPRRLLVLAPGIARISRHHAEVGGRR